jgi:hypothetical protein
MQQPTACVQVVFYSSGTDDIFFRIGCMFLGWQTLLLSFCPACLDSYLTTLSITKFYDDDDR